MNREEESRKQKTEGNRDGNAGDDFVKPAAGINGVTGELTEESAFEQSFNFKKKEFAQLVEEESVEFSTGGKAE